MFSLWRTQRMEPFVKAFAYDVCRKSTCGLGYTELLREEINKSVRCGRTEAHDTIEEARFG